jgi:flagellar hook-associated protein 2
MTMIATTSSSATGLSSISGVASGLNFNNIVSQLMAVEQSKITLLQSQQAGITAQQQAMTQLQGYLTTLQNQASSMSNSFNFLSYTGTLTSNTSTAASSLLSVQTSSSATPATHTLVVSQLAKAMSEGSSAAVTDSTGTAATSSSAALGISGSFTVNGQTVNVTATDSLQSIAGNINQLDTGSGATGVTASVMQVGTNDYRLVLTNDATGATGFTLGGTALASGGSLAGLQLGTPQSLQAGQDANLTVDGYAVTSSSNTISNAISGVTLNLTNADPATTMTLKVGVDTQAVTKNIQAFVDDYNQVMDFINKQKTYDSTTKTSGPLAADPLVSNIQSQLSSTLLQSIPGLSSSANSLVLIGVTPDQTGHLSIDSTTLDSLLNSNPNAVKDVFAATGTSTNSAISFVNYGSNTVSGSYPVNITQAATQASVTGTTALTGGLASAESVTVTDGSGQQAVVNLTAGESLTNIVSAMNTEFGKSYAQQLSVGGFAAGTTSATTLSSLGFAAGDTIAISGTSHSGASVGSTYTVAAGDTVASLLSAIQYANNQQATATIDSAGNIVLTDNQTGQSSLSMNLAYSAAGGGTFAGFAASSTAQVGRYAMSITASATAAGMLQLTDSTYGAGSSFSVSQSVNNLGIANASFTGTDVAGTIGGLAATGSGQILTGTAGNANGLSLMYTGAATGAVGTLNASLGVGALYDNMLNTLATPGSGLVSTDITSMQTSYDNLSQQIVNVQAQMNQEQATLLAGFQAMETTIANLNASGQYLTQLSQMSSNASGSFK